ncbi:MAG: translation initiation factor IF-5A [Candidatus Pacearchaeota archaeon]|nr:translation initiation factor IF-5A [Candidatus Pacearchaeota archaeon]
MVLKVVSATELRVGSYILIEGEGYCIKSIEISKTGKHGASKCRIEAISVIDGKKKVIMCPGHERFEVPMIDKRKAQVLSVSTDKVSIMDSENFENFELALNDEVKENIAEGKEVEYWDVEGTRVLKRVL